MRRKHDSGFTKKMHVLLGVKGGDRKLSEGMSDIQQSERRRTSGVVN